MIDEAFRGEPMRAFAGCGLSPLTASQLFDRLISRLQAGERSLLVGHHNLHSLYLYRKQPEVADFYRQCDNCYIDGVGALWLLRAAGVDTRSAHRFSLMDRFPDLLDLAREKGLRVFYLGGSQEAVQRARAWLSAGWPELEIGLHHGYVEHEPGVVERINAFEPDLLLVGMGMPHQERWIVDNRPVLNAGAILQAGGTLDYYTGLQARPPDRFSRIGLAWLYRLLHDPKRLWHRYLVTPWALLGPALALRRSLRGRRR